MPHLSDSQLEMFLGCPEQWRTKYMDPQFDAEPSDALILGKAFHAVLELDGNQRIKNRNVGLTLRELKREFSRFLAEAHREADPENRLINHLDVLEERGWAMLDAFMVGVVGDQENVYRPVGIEEEFEFVIPGMPRINSETYEAISQEELAENPQAGEPWTFVGRIDARVLTTRNGKNTLEIWDWKTASKPWQRKSDGKPWSKNDEDEKGQATAYIISDILMGRNVAERVTFVTFPTTLVKGKWTCTVDKRPTERGLREIDAYLKYVRMAAREIMLIRQGVKEAIPRPYWKCRFCHNLGDCIEGVQYHERKGIPLPAHIRLSPKVTEYIEQAI